MINEWEYQELIDFRDKSIFLVGNILGCRCDSLAAIKLKHINFKIYNLNGIKKIHSEWSIVKDKCSKKNVNRTVNITHHSDPKFDPNIVTIEWLFKRYDFLFIYI